MGGLDESLFLFLVKHFEHDRVGVRLVENNQFRYHAERYRFPTTPQSVVLLRRHGDSPTLTTFY